MNQSRRRIIQHLGLFVLAILITAVFYAVGNEERTLANFSIATAYSSFIFLIISLTIGPIQVLGKSPNPLSSYVRRDVGIWSGVLALTHTVVGLQIHFTGRMYLYFLFPSEWQKFLPLRYDTFGIANYTGMFATALYCFLLFLSNKIPDL